MQHYCTVSIGNQNYLGSCVSRHWRWTLNFLIKMCVLNENCRCSPESLEHPMLTRTTNSLYPFVECSDALVFFFAERMRLMLYSNIVLQCLFDNNKLQPSYFTNQSLSKITDMNSTYLLWFLLLEGHILQAAANIIIVMIKSVNNYSWVTLCSWQMLANCLKMPPT